MNQEEVIARKRQEILEKQKTNELAKQVAAAQTSTTVTEDTTLTQPPTALKDAIKTPTFDAEPPQPKNSFTNDGSFLENFRKITEAAAKKAEEEKQKKEKLEAERLAKEQEQQQKAESVEHFEQNREQIMPPQPIPP